MKASYFELDHANCTVLPVQKPMPPVWIGANIDVGIRRAARMADAWFVNPHNKLDTIEQQMDVYRRELDAAASRSRPNSRWRAKCSSPARATRRSAWHGHHLEVEIQGVSRRGARTR